MPTIGLPANRLGTSTSVSCLYFPRVSAEERLQSTSADSAVASKHFIQPLSHLASLFMGIFPFRTTPGTVGITLFSPACHRFSRSAEKPVLCNSNLASSASESPWPARGFLLPRARRRPVLPAAVLFSVAVRHRSYRECLLFLNVSRMKTRLSEIGNDFSAIFLIIRRFFTENGHVRSRQWCRP